MPLLSKRGGKPVSFLPSDLPSLALWLAADKIPGLSDGSAVATWPDASGNSRDGTAAGGVRPTYKTSILNGLPVVRFDASDDLLDCGDFMAGASGISIFAVWKVVQANNATIAVSKHAAFGSGGEWVFRLPQATNLLEETQFTSDTILTNTSKTSAIGSQGFCLSQALWAGSTEPLLFTNGVQLAAVSGSGWASIATFPTTANHVRIGNVPSYSGPAGGDIAELVIYNRKVTASERRSIESYLLHKWFRWQVACDGNSLTSGKSSGTETTNYLPYPTQLTSLLSQSAVAYNFGVAGQTTSSMTSDAATEIDPLLDGSYGKRVVVAWEVTNEIAFGVSAATAYSNLVTYCNARRTAGWKVLVLTVLPRSDAAIDADFETKRQTVNTNIRSNWATFADGLVDVAADTRIGDAGDELDTTYYLIDKVHLNNTGAAIVAAAVATAINAL